MSWNYRILAKEYKGIIYFGIHSVYYDENDIPNGYSQTPSSIVAEDLETIEFDLTKMKECLSKPILWGNDKFPNEYKK